MNLASPKLDGAHNADDCSLPAWGRMNKHNYDFESAVPLSAWKNIPQDRIFVEFDALAACTSCRELDEKLARQSKYRPKNRYSDILAYENTRVKLGDRGFAGDPDVNAYINANFVDSPL